LFDHALYSTDLAPSGYRLITCLNNWLGSQRFNNNEELMEGVKIWLSSKVADFFDTGIQKLIPNTGASIPAVTALKSTKIVRILFLHIITFFLIACFVTSSPGVTLRIALVFRKGFDFLTGHP
jgi:hypothetical protein